MSLAKIKCRDGHMRTKTELDTLKQEYIKLEDEYLETLEKYNSMK